MDRAAIQKEFDALLKRLNIDVDPGATGVKKSIRNLFSKQQSTPSSPEQDAERRRLMKRYKGLGQTLADMPDTETRFP